MPIQMRWKEIRKILFFFKSFSTSLLQDNNEKNFVEKWQIGFLLEKYWKYLSKKLQTKQDLPLSFHNRVLIPHSPQSSNGEWKDQ